MQNKEKLKLDLADILIETYTKAFLAYRISLENWFLLNEILAILRNERLEKEEIQNKLEKFLSEINTEIIEELGKLNIKA
jgi:hypothetical protein